MPELPDVEGFRRLLEHNATGRRIHGVQVRDTGVLRGVKAKRFVETVSGRRFGVPRRHGKWLIAPLDGSPSSILWHFGMTGSLEWCDTAASERHPHDRIVINVDGGALVYRDQRKLQGVWLADGEDDLDRLIADQGPDALGISGRELSERLGDRHKSIKSAMMDQHVIAGIGNLLSDEVLWRSNVYPGRRFAELSARERQRLHRCLQQVLRAAIRQGRIPDGRGWLTGARNNADARCPRCGHALADQRFDGRRARWCPACQPPP